MTFTLFTLAFLAPAMASAAAFPSLPQPTQSVAKIDNWSPAPTAAPVLPFGLLRRENEGNNTCGFVSPSSAITCHDPSFICATNTFFGVHGCCDPSSPLSDCMIPTTCIPSTSMASQCTDSACTSDAAVTTCTDPAAAECYKWLFVYSKTTMTQHGCAASAFTSTASTAWDGDRTTVTVTKEADISPAPSLSQSPPDEDSTGDSSLFQPEAPSSSSTPSLGAIIGGTIGACVFVSFIAFVVFRAWRRRSQRYIVQPPRVGCNSTGSPMVGYNTLGFPGQATVYSENACAENKVWQERRDTRDEQAWHYPGVQVGVVEVDGRSRVVEAPTVEK